MDENKFWVLAGLVLSGEATGEESAQFETMLRENPELRQKFLGVKPAWENKTAVSETSAESAFGRHLQRLSNHLSEPVLKYEGETRSPEQIVRSKKLSLLRSMIFATVAAASLVVATLLVHPFNEAVKSKVPAPQNTVTTKPGSRSKVELPDGTQVWLNADSRLRYDDELNADTRSVYLSGEAYFDVVKDKNRPFIIHTSTIDIKVLGTAFNVRAYKNEKSTETALFRGSVEIIAHNNPERKIILKPLEKLVIQNTPPEVKTGAVTNSEPEDKPLMMISKVHLEAKDSAARDILWTYNKLSFDSESLESVALKVERWFDVKVTITDEKLKRKLYSAVFEYEDLKQVMEALRLTGNFKYSINKKQVTITP